MSDYPITFISGRWKLIENRKRQCVSLRYAWKELCGWEPHLGPSSYTVVGVHAPGESPDVRTLRFMHAASPRAVTRAAVLIGFKYQCEVETLGWYRISEKPNEWVLNAPPRRFDVSGLSVWPIERIGVNDAIVLRLRGREARFIGPGHPVTRVEDALCFVSARIAWNWIRTNGISPPSVDPTYRSVALCAQDQRLAGGQA